MRTSHFASIQVVVTPDDASYAPPVNSKPGVLRTVGMAQNITIDDTFGTKAENSIGTPLPVLAPGYQLTTIRLEKATLDGADFRNLGAFNPLWAHVGAAYNFPVNIAMAGNAVGIPDKEMYPFMFVLAVRNRVSNSTTNSNITTDNLPAPPKSLTARTNSFGVYVCVLQSASIGMQSQQAVIMDSVVAVARPLVGTWFSKAVRQAYSKNGDSRNGLLDIVNSVLYCYRS